MTALRRALIEAGYAIALGLLLAAAIGTALAACAELPPCPKVSAAVLQSQNDGVFYLGFTIETMDQLREMIQKEARGECAFRKKEGDL